jgi:periplasmic protein TonB
MNPLTNLFTIFIMETKRKTVPLLKLKFYMGFIAIGIFLITSYSCSENAKSITDVMEGTIPLSPPPIAEKNQNTTAEEGWISETPFVVVEEMPEFPGGDIELLKFIAENTVYPQVAKENGTQGRVIVRFCVTKNGGISQASILKGVSPELDTEALRVVSQLPSFKPGKQGGRPVPVWYMVPISFALQ